MSANHATADHDGPWDVFLAHASPDKARVEELYALLDEKGLRVFLDARSVPDGENWFTRIPEALATSRLIAVLVSDASKEAIYQQDEIARAIEMARDPASRRRVLPVYLDGIPPRADDRPFGLSVLQSLDLPAAGGLEGVAVRLVERVEALEEAPRAAAREQPAAGLPDSYLGYFHAAALELDRSEQWLPLVRQSRTDRNAMFLLDGERRQNLELFVARLWHFLPEESERDHRMVSVPWRVEYAVPGSAAAWENNLRAAFPGARGTAQELLREASRSRPLFLVLGELPLGEEDFVAEDSGEALAEFLEHELPALMTRARSTHPIRALLATHHDPGAPSLRADFELRIEAGVGRPGVEVEYRRLPRVRAVEWSHIEAYLDNRAERPPAWIYDELRRMYDALDRDSISFRELAERLQRHLSR